MRKYILLPITLLVLLVLLAGCYPIQPEQPVGVVSSAGIDTNTSAVFYDGANITIYSDDHDTSKFSVTGSTGAVSAAADLDVGTWINLSAQSAVVVTAGSTITPTGTYQVITSTAAVTTSTTTAIANGGETGDLLILRNANASNAITIDGTGGNVECKSDVALGAGDTLLLIWNGSDWNCLSSYDNS